MRSPGGIFEALASVGALQQAWVQAARGKRKRRDVCAFEGGWPGALVDLAQALRDGSWRPGGYRSFVWCERGKRRLISAAPFADRVVHHAITAALEPAYERRFLPWSFANRRGRGTHAGLALALQGAARFRWVLKLDVQRFFPSVDHAVLLGLLRSAVHERAFAELLVRIVAHPRKTRLWDAREGVPFVGYRVFPWGAKLPGPSVTRLRSHLRAVAEAYADGALDLAGAKQRILGLIGHARPARAEAVLGRALEDYPLVRSPG